MKRSGLALLIATAGVLLLVSLGTPAWADCGGDGQRACCNGCGEYSNVSTACNGGNYLFGTDTSRACGGPITCTIPGFTTKDVCHAPKACGGQGQRACCFLEDGRSLSCNSGLVEGPGCTVGDPNCLCKGGSFASGVCTAPACGGSGQRGCCTGEQGARGTNGPCFSGLLELGSCAGQLGSGACACLQPSGSSSLGVCTDPGCGGPGQRGCCVGAERTVKGISGPCVFPAVEHGTCTGDCACKSPAGFASSGHCTVPTACGGEGQRACGLGDNLPACQAGLVQTNTTLANLFGFSTQSCSDQLGEDACVTPSGALSNGVCKRVHCGGDGERGCCVGDERTARGISGPCAAGNAEDTLDGCTTGTCACTGTAAVGNSLGVCHAATACGGKDQRACCFGLEAAANPGIPPDSPTCNSGNIEIAGCTGNCFCGGLGIGEKSSGTCRENTHPTPCGGAGQRACCAGTLEVLPGKACNAGFVEIPGCGDDCKCGGFNPFTILASSTCVQPSTCGGAGQRACCISSGEFPSSGGPVSGVSCNVGLIEVPGCSGDCFCGGTTLGSGATSLSSCTTPVYNANGSVQSLAKIAEPDAAWTAPDAAPACGMRGYADMHLHLFAEMAHGGGVLAGKAWDPGPDGINEALKQDFGTNLNLVSKTNLSTNTTRELGAPNCPVWLPNCGSKLFHGDHTPLDDTVGVFSNDKTNSNLGAPLFNGWPRWSNVTHQQAYYKWLERAWRGGLRMVSMLAVSNEALCLGNKKLRGTDCDNSMKPLDDQIQKAKDFQSWLDTQSGGPGQGWFQIAYSPADARRIIGQGKLAVVLGIEVDNLFNCKADGSRAWRWNGSNWVKSIGNEYCDEGYVRSEVQRYAGMGVRHVFPVHNFDNGYGATATWFDSINVGNRVSEGFYYTAEECANLEYGFRLSSFIAPIVQLLGFGGLDLPNALPPYELLVATCNAKGLTSLGNALIDEMMKQHMLIDVDHMGNHALDQTLTLAENYQASSGQQQCSSSFQCGNGVCCPYGSRRQGTCADSDQACSANAGYPVIASHVLIFDLYQQGARTERMRRDDQFARIKALGGMVAPITEMRDSADNGSPVSVQYGDVANDCRRSSKTFAQVFQKAVDLMGGPVGLGTDFNGTAFHLSPRFGSEGCDGVQADRSTQYRSADHGRLAYPFTADAFGTLGKLVTGEKTFDYNVDGLAHVGLLPDFIADMKKVGLPDATLEMLWQSAEGFVEVWERAEGTSTVPSVGQGGQCAALQDRYGQPIEIIADEQCQVLAATVGRLAASDGRLSTTLDPAGPFAMNGGYAQCVDVSATDTCSTSGASSHCGGCFKVVDRTPPTLNCPANVTAPSTGALTHPSIPSVLVADNCATFFNSTDFGPGTSFFGCNHNPASGFPPGSTTVTCTARDDFGNQSSCSYTVTITPPAQASQTISFAALSDKTYGDQAFSVSATASSGLPVNLSLVSGPATLSGSTVSVTGVGTVTLKASQPGNASYLPATDVTGSFVVAPKPITVAADAKAKAYGDADPPLTSRITSGGLVFSDAFTGALARTAGENAGLYAIQQGTLTVSGNYALSFVGASFTIGQKSITVTADLKSKTYGDSDPPLTFTNGSLAFNDAFTGALARAAGENAGTYAIQQGTLALSGNYALNFVGAKLTISQAPPRLSWTGALSGTYNQSATLMASLAFGPGSALAGTAIPGEAVTFTLAPSAPGAQSCAGLTQASGEASCTLTVNQPHASYIASASFAGDYNFLPTSISPSFEVAPDPTTTVYTGATKGEYLGWYTLSALVAETSSGLPAAAGTLVHFSFGQPVELQGCSGPVDPAGSASCSVQIGQPAGSYPVIATAFGNGYYDASSTSSTFVVSADTTSLVYTGPRLIAAGQPFTASANFTDTFTNTPLAGQSIAFTLGSQGCSGTTDQSGTASCTISNVSQPLGPASIAASFAGNGNYLAASAVANVLVFAYLPGGGSFVIADTVAQVGSSVTFWGSRWGRTNHPSGGPAPKRFKGFADAPTQPACGAAFTAHEARDHRDGDDDEDDADGPRPPASVPAYQAVIASSSIKNSHGSVVGDSPRIVIVKTSTGYTPNRGHAGTGTVVAVLCGDLNGRDGN